MISFHYRFLSRLIAPLLCLFSCPIFSQTYEPLKNIETAAYQFVLASVHDDIKRPEAVEVKVSSLDPRLRLSACGQNLEAFFPDGATRVGNTSVGVRCNGSKPWTLYVPVRVSIFYDVYIAAHPLSRGTVLSENDLNVAKNDISSLSNGFVTDLNDIIGKVLTRPLRPGMPVLKSILRTPDIVTRGELVSILATVGPLEVRMRGKALNAGAAGDRVQVRSNGSNRVVEGIVTETGTIKVSL